MVISFQTFQISLFLFGIISSLKMLNNFINKNLARYLNGLFNLLFIILAILMILPNPKGSNDKIIYNEIIYTGFTNQVSRVANQVSRVANQVSLIANHYNIFFY